MALLRNRLTVPCRPASPVKEHALLPHNAGLIGYPDDQKHRTNMDEIAIAKELSITPAYLRCRMLLGRAAVNQPAGGC
jgi:hypothetical protein